jgi:hypothetical protein
METQSLVSMLEMDRQFVGEEPPKPILYFEIHHGVTIVEIEQNLSLKLKWRGPKGDTEKDLLCLIPKADSWLSHLLKALEDFAQNPALYPDGIIHVANKTKSLMSTQVRLLEVEKHHFKHIYDKEQDMLSLKYSNLVAEVNVV